MSTMTIGQLADSAGVNVETVRYYQRRGLLREPPRPPGGGIRRYEGTDARRLGFIRRAQAMGFSLSEIAGLADANDALGCEHTRQLAEHKLADVQARIRALHTLETELSNLIDECAGTPTGCRCPALHRFGKGGQHPSGIL